MLRRYCVGNEKSFPKPKFIQRSLSQWIMLQRYFYQETSDLSLLYGKTIAVIGYGSQGHAHALNAKESLGDKARVIIGLYKGSKSWGKG